MEKFWIKYENKDSVQNGAKFLVREADDEEHYYFIADGKSHIGSGRLLKKYCHKINLNTEGIDTKEIHDSFVEILNPDGSLLCKTNNMLTFNNVRMQIKAKQLEGYTVVVTDTKIITKIDSDGGIDKWPAGLFDTATKQLNYLLGI